MKVALALGSMLVALVLSLGVGEAVLRAAAGRSAAYQAWTPHRRMAFRLPPGRAPGIGAHSQFSANADGIRGDSFSAAQHYRILAVGGSTTECLLLDDSLAWPHLLQEALNQHVGRGAGGGGDAQIWVGNVGRSGLRAAHNALHVQYLLPEYPHIDAIIVLVGINDFQNRLGRDGEAPVEMTQLMQMAFDELPRRYRPGPSYKRTEIWRRLRTLKAWIGKQGPIQDDRGDNLVTWQRHRQTAARIRESLPDLGPALAAYRHDLNAIIDGAARFNARVILATQPAMWRPGLPAGLKDLLWLGGVGDFQVETGKDYYSVEALARGLDQYNQALLEVCRTRGVECIDLAAAVPKDTTIFYDDVHFNERGSKRLAQILSTYLLTHGTLGGLASPSPSSSPRVATVQHSVSASPTTRSAP
jgi:lysophospholipase L1-like esterase